MKIAACLLVVRVSEYQHLKSFARESEELVRSEGKQRVLPTNVSREQVIITEEPYTEGETQEEPSYQIGNCLISVRLWYNVFDGPAVSLIMVGPPDEIVNLKGKFAQPIHEAMGPFFIMPWGFFSDPPKKSFSERFKESVDDGPPGPNELSLSEDIFDGSDGLLEKYFYAELLIKDLKDFKEGILELQYTGPTLWDETKSLKIAGERVSGEPEILHEIEDYFRDEEFFPITRNQIKMILQLVPEVFPADWVNPNKDKELSLNQQVAYKKITGEGIQAVSTLVIQKVIRLALDIKQQYGE